LFFVPRGIKNRLWNIAIFRVATRRTSIRPKAGEEFYSFKHFSSLGIRCPIWAAPHRTLRAASADDAPHNEHIQPLVAALAPILRAALTLPVNNEKR
jgi:hypothetical protein